MRVLNFFESMFDFDNKNIDTHIPYGFFYVYIGLFSTYLRYENSPIIRNACHKI